MEEWTGMLESDGKFQDLCAKLEGEFSFNKFFVSKTRRVPLFIHVATGVEFALAEGGTYRMGLSKAEEQEFFEIAVEYDVETMARAIIPTLIPEKEVQVRDFLISTAPVSFELADSAIEIDWDLFRADFDEGQNPICLNHAEADALCKLYGMRRPTEAEWEYCYRAGTDTLFTFGNDLPDDVKYMNDFVCFCDLNSLASEEERDSKRNEFGLIATGVEECCEDVFVPGGGQTSSNSEDTGYVIKGGAASLWPWQDSYEWILCMSAMRRSSLDFEDGTAAFRLVKELPE